MYTMPTLSLRDYRMRVRARRKEIIFEITFSFAVYISKTLKYV